MYMTDLKIITVADIKRVLVTVHKEVELMYDLQARVMRSIHFLTSFTRII